MMTASSAFLEPQHSLSTSPGIATGTETLARKRLTSSALAIKISVDASKTIIMTKYDNRNSSTDFKLNHTGERDSYDASDHKFCGRQSRRGLAQETCVRRSPETRLRRSMAISSNGAGRE